MVQVASHRQPIQLPHVFLGMPSIVIINIAIIIATIIAIIAIIIVIIIVIIIISQSSYPTSSLECHQLSSSSLPSLPSSLSSSLSSPLSSSLPSSLSSSLSSSSSSSPIVNCRHHRTLRSTMSILFTIDHHFTFRALQCCLHH